MARFSVVINAVSVSAAQDIYEVVASASRGFWIHELYLDQKTLTSGRLGVNIIDGYTVSGSGGGSPAVVPLDQPSATFGGTAPESNNTTGAAGGTASVARAMVWNLVAGLLYLPVPEDRIWVPPSTRMVVRLIDAPSGAMTMSGALVIDE
jgi:hypothetical protein